MTLPEGRQPIEAEDMAKLHPSTWAEEVEQLRRDYGLMKTDRNNLRNLLDEAEDEADKLNDKMKDAEAEAKALRARVAKLEAALTRLVDMVAILPPKYDEPGSAIHQARAALQQPTEPHTASHSAKSTPPQG